MEPRGIRNHNPGNIRISPNRWRGMAEQQTDDQFVQFRSPYWGLRAMAKLLLAYRYKHGLDNVRAIIGRWAPPVENDTGAYSRRVAKELGVDPDDPVNLEDQVTLVGLMAAIVRHENGEQPYPRELIVMAAKAAREG